MMKVHSFSTPYMRSLSYLVVENDHAFVVDPCELETVRNIVHQEKLTIDFAFLSHEHYDHISGVDWIRSFGTKIIASEACDKNLRDPRKNQSRYYEAFCSVQSRLANDEIPEVHDRTFYADVTYSEEMSFTWQGHFVYLKATPGHSEGSACLLIDKNTLFSGDTLFADRETNTNLPGGSIRQLQSISLPWLKTLDHETVVYPGHYQSFVLHNQ